METAESAIEFLNSNLVQILGWVGIILSIFLMVSPTIKTRRFNIGNRTTRSPVNERARFKFGAITLIIWVLLLVGPLSLKSNKEIGNINLNDWTGEWQVNSEEPNRSIGYFDSDDRYTLEFEIDNDGELRGQLLNGRGREQGGISSVEVQEAGYGYLEGKYGNNDGRKMEIELILFPDKLSFMGRYRNRRGSDPWKIWIGKKVK